MAKVLVLGSNFAGSTAALQLARILKSKEHEISVIAPGDKFLYVPSLIWVPFGKRKVDQISFAIGPVLKKKGIRYISDKAVQIIPEMNKVKTQSGTEYEYDYLVVATGVSVNTNVVKGFENVECIVTPPMAEKAAKAFEELVKNPGPVVVGATQGASCMGAAYEYLFNLEKELRRNGVRDKVPITWITPEPELGHFGIGGIRGGELMLTAFMKMFKMNYRTNAKVKTIEPNQITLESGEVLPFKMAMLIPPFEGADVVKNSGSLGDEKGFIACDDHYQSREFSNIYAAGLAVQVKSPFTKCAVPFGVPKTGFPSDVQGKIVAHNIAQKINGQNNFKEMPFGKIPGICIMDAGSKEVIILTDHLFKPRRFEIMIPNVIDNIGKKILEIYMIFKNRHGLSWLP